MSTIDPSVAEPVDVDCLCGHSADGHEYMGTAMNTDLIYTFCHHCKCDEFTKDDEIDCPACEGAGEIGVSQDYYGNWNTVACRHCDNTGVIQKSEMCGDCAGTGLVTDKGYGTGSCAGCNERDF